MTRRHPRGERGAVTAERAALMVAAAMIPMLMTGFVRYSTAGPSPTQRAIFDWMLHLFEQVMAWVRSWLR